MKPLIALAADLASGKTTSQALVEGALTRIAAPWDALLMPTVVMVAPAITPLDKDDQLYGKTNAAILRNPGAVNFLDGCALSIPCHRPGGAPVGRMVVGQGGEDRRLLSVGLAIEPVLRG